MINRAQGTVEYLVILAVVIVISLVVVGLFVNMIDSPSQQVTVSSTKISSISGEISITDSVIDSQGDSLIKLSNNSSDAITLKKISVGAVELDYSEQLVGLDSKVISLSDINLSCPCVGGQKSVKCELDVEYISSSGITKVEHKTITAECVVDSVPVDVTKVVENIDIDAPVVLLNSPSGSTSSKVVDFNFSVTETNAISSCTLRAGNDSNNYAGIVVGNNIVRYTFSTDKYFDWNISCTDDSANIGSSSSNTLDIDSNSQEISTCLELQELGAGLTGNYVLMNDINCLGISMVPIGSGTGAAFTGSLDGNYYKIMNASLSRNDLNSVGIFGYVTGNIRRINLVDLNIYSLYSADVYVGGLAGYSSGTITDVNASGTVYGATSGAANYARVGGIVGRTLGTITNSNSSVTFNILSGNVGRMHIGGLVGEIGDNASIFGNVNSCFATGDINSSTSGNRVITGGLVGYAVGTISDSYARGNLYSIETYVGPQPPYSGGLVGLVYDGNVWRSYATGNVILNGGGQAAGNAGPRGGGLAGGISATGRANGRVGIYYSFATGDVNLFSGVDNPSGGGLVGIVLQGGKISDSFATGDVNTYGNSSSGSSSTNSGGLVGFAQSGGWTIMNSYSTGNIFSFSLLYKEIGLILGGNSLTSGNTIRDSFGFGTTTGIAYVGVFEGGIDGWLGCMPSTILNNYWYSSTLHPSACYTYINPGYSLTDANCMQILSGTSYFFDSLNAPLNVWSASNWYFSGTGLPVPKWANDAGIIAWDTNGIPYVN